MDLFKKFLDLVNESLHCKSYKELAIVKRILCIIALVPFIALYVVALLVYWLFAIIYKCAYDLLEYVHALIQKERAEVRHATEVVIYIFAFPVILTMKLFNAFLALVLMVIHFFASSVGYVATFGGIKFSPFIFDCVDRYEEKAFVKHCKAAVIVFIVIGLVLLTLSCLFKHVTYEFYKIYMNESIRTTLLSEMERAKKENLITNSQWNDFVGEYVADGVDVYNYMEYERKYLANIEHKTWDMEKSVEFCTFIDITYPIIIVVYTLFTTLYVSIYSNCIKRRKMEETPMGAPEIIFD